MLTVNLICVGKCKEAYLREGCGEYQKRLTAYCNLNIVEIPAVSFPQNPSPAEIAQGVLQEGRLILKRMEKGYHYALCIEGKSLDSPAFSRHISERAIAGESQLNFMIGGSYGLSDEVKQKAGLRFSLSAMTFPHQLARFLLLEQVYRAFQIASNGQYHK